MNRSQRNTRNNELKAKVFMGMLNIDYGAYYNIPRYLNKKSGIKSEIAYWRYKNKKS